MVIMLGMEYPGFCLCQKSSTSELHPQLVNHIFFIIMFINRNPRTKASWIPLDVSALHLEPYVPSALNISASSYASLSFSLDLGLAQVSIHVMKIPMGQRPFPLKFQFVPSILKAVTLFVM